jgi:hypothetical protein
LINFVGSVQRQSDIFDEIVVYDLGMTPFQRRLLENARGVEVRTVPPFVPHWRGGFTWKTWIWTHLEADIIVWLDAGITVLRPLTDPLEQIRERGYFVVSSGVTADKSTPTDYYSLYDLPRGFGDRISIAGGIIGFDRSSSFYASVIEPTFHDAVLGRSLGFSEAEVAKLNWGLNELDELLVRDCEIFRHDQTLLTIHFYRSVADPVVNELDQYGGFKSPHDHPEQVIWSHRRRGDYRFLPRVRYERQAARGLAWGTAVYARWTFLRYRWLLRPGFYAHLARRLVTTGRLRAPHS